MADLFGYEPITRFSGRYDFLSNFYLREILYKGVRFRSTEYAFQWDKTTDPAEQREILDAYSNGKAKRLGRKVTKRPDWDEIHCFQSMFDVNLAKFTQHPDLRTLLLETEDAILIEGNTWCDNFWGNCICPKCVKIPGKNHLGKTHMRLRDHFRKAVIL